MYMTNQLKGVWGTIQVPFDKRENVDYVLLDEQIQYLGATSLHGVYSNGTAAEFFNQTEDEFDDIHALLAARLNVANKPFQIGVSHMSPVVSLERLKRAKHFDPQAFQLIFPDWLCLNTQERRAFLARMLAEANPIPIVLYMPGHAKNRLNFSELSALSAEFPGLVGVKIGNVNPEEYDAARSLNQQLSVFIPGHHMATGIIQGIGAGSYSNVACINPNAARYWYNTIVANDTCGFAIERSIQLFFNQEIIPLASQGYSDPALDKLLAAIGGKVPGNAMLRWPYQSFESHQVIAIREVGKRMLPLFFED